MIKHALLQGDISRWLDEYEGERFHAALGDTPYALIENSKRFSAPDAKAPVGLDAGRNGVFTRQAKGFMGQSWDGFESLAAYQSWVTEWASKLHKVMHPGALVAFFGGSRTWHRLAVGLEDAGLDIVDTIIWGYGSGMPKSLNIGLAIDKQSGQLPAKRRRFKADGTPIHNIRPGDSVAHGDYGDKDLGYSDPITEAGRRWKGHGSLLKPAFEPLVIARLPRNGATFADLALQYGTGGFNIDQSRVPVEGAAYRSDGRFPGNVVLTHSTGCQCIGKTKIHTGGGDTGSNNTPKGRDIYNFGGTERTPFIGYGDVDDMETVQIWDCVPGCAVGAIHALSPHSTRFFYAGKAATWERCAGLKSRSLHPTMKPIQLTAYLTGLLLPAPLPIPRRLLVPFAGVGSEMIGAYLAGWDEIVGVELTPEYIPIAESRLKWWSQYPDYESAQKAYNHVRARGRKADQLKEIETKAGVKRLPLFPELD